MTLYGAFNKKTDEIMEGLKGLPIDSEKAILLYKGCSFTVAVIEIICALFIFTV